MECEVQVELEVTHQVTVRMNDDKLEVRMTLLTRHKQLQPELWLSLEPRKKIRVCGTCGMCACVV